METPVLVFIGFMGAGKTTGARAAAAALGVRAIDTDRELEQRLGTSIEDYFASHGERAFRETEEDVVAEVLETPPGAGHLDRRRRDRLRPRARAAGRHTVVMLDVDEPTAWRRAGGKRRPLARDRERFAALHAERAPVYEALADAVLLDGGAETVRRAAGALRRDPARRQGRCGRSPASHNYPVYVGDVLDGDFWPVRGRRFLLTDETVAAAPRRPRARARRRRSRCRPGRRPRRWPTPRSCCAGWRPPGWTTTTTWPRSAAASSATWPGFCAAVYQRGVGVVQVPTTLVAQVDSAYGGKTGVDLPEGKNYVGAYHQPRAVLADPRTLATLPAAELAAGWAEVIKTALIAGGPLWSRVRRGEGIVDRDLVLACARTKLAVVARDERDAGRRQVLNLGHTVGHAIETATGYARYRHGEAVGLGLLAALTLSGQPDLRCEVSDLLEAHGLPTKLDPSIDHEAVLAAVQRDKKRRGGRVGFVLVEAPGDVRTGAPVAERDVRAALGGLLMKNRVAVLHGINLGALDRRPGAALRRADVHAARAADRRVRARARACRSSFFQSNHEGEFVEELHKAPRLRRRAAAQPGRVDALRVVAARRGRDLRAAGDRGAPVRRRRARGVPARLGARGACAPARCRARASTATARRWCC